MYVERWLKMVWVITCGALLLLLFFGKKGFAGVNTMSDTKPITLDDIIEYNAKEYSIPTALIKAIIKKESSWNPYAKNPNDPSYGLMGIMPIVAQEAGFVNDYKNVTQVEINSIYVTQNNIMSGCKLLHKLLKKYNMDVAVEMYNVGERGYNELGRRNGPYRMGVLEAYQDYINEEAGV